jgi:hypothetical protein
VFFAAPDGPVANQPIGVTVQQLPTIRFAWFNMLSALTTGERLAPLHSPTPPPVPVETAALDKKQTAINARRNQVDRKWQQYEVGATIATPQNKRQVEPDRSCPTFRLPPFPAAALAPLMGYTPPRRAKDQRLVALSFGGLSRQRVDELFVQRPTKDKGEGRVAGTHRGRVTKWSLLQRQLPPRDKADRRMNIEQYDWLIDSPRRSYFLARLV